MNSPTPSLNFSGISRKIALDTTRVYVEAFSNRLFPTYYRISEEADEAANEAWNTAMSSPYVDGGRFDEGDFAEAAEAHGLEVYENLVFTQQQLHGLAVAGLYHLWERLLKQFLCKELRDWKIGERSAKEAIGGMDFSRLEDLLAQFGFPLKESPIYPALNELRLVANVVKHGDGKSCDALKAAAPQLFSGYQYHFDIYSTADSLVIELRDFERYVEAVRQFWGTFPEYLTESSDAAASVLQGASSTT